MRIDRILLTWFRGAADNVTLDTRGKSVVVYGDNAAGKSTFVDALEYTLTNGRVEHLAHEYSGVRQEKGLLNTSAPPDTPARIRLEFSEDRNVEIEVAPSGDFTVSSSPPTLIKSVQSWPINSILLRQDQVASFIQAPKGPKYSILLPFLGVAAFEHTAENLRQLAERVATLGSLHAEEYRLAELRSSVASILPSLEDAAIRDSMAEIASRYGVGETASLSNELTARIGRIDPEHRTYLLLDQVRSARLSERFAALVETESKARELVTSFIDHHLAVLEQAEQFAKQISGDSAIECPACGQKVEPTELREHITVELKRLNTAQAARVAARSIREDFAAALAQALNRLGELTDWLALEEQHGCREAVERLNGCSFHERDHPWSDHVLDTLQICVPAIDRRIGEVVAMAPAPTQQLMDDKRTADAANSLVEVRLLERKTGQIRALQTTLRAIESGVREEIKARTSAVIGTISVEAQRIWAKLHPDEPIEDIHLHIPNDADKAIDIALVFHGVPQPSPRLALSEGHRNSLGLCIFLALARLTTAEPRPIVLDDVVSSFDRAHRGALVDILREDLRDHQVLVFTHDREWFTELRHILPGSDWQFLRLRPWLGPHTGIRWFDSTESFADARAQIADNPESAGNTARRVMDTSLSIAADRLRLHVEHRRGDRNDQRMANEFIQRLISEGGRLRKREGEGWVPSAEAQADWRATLSLLASRANRASHAGSLTTQEAESLIASCESALSHFKCTGCGSFLWTLDNESAERMQCSCGTIRWLYR